MADEYDIPAEDTRSLFGPRPVTAANGNGFVQPPPHKDETDRTVDQAKKYLSDDEVQQAIGRNMVRRHALLIAEQLTLAAHYHPVLLRSALASVFDLRAFEAEARSVAATVSAVRASAENYQRQLADQRAEVEALRESIRLLTAECYGLMRKLEAAEAKAMPTFGGQHRSPPPQE